MSRGDGFDADDGFTIIEVVVAITLLLVAFLAAAGSVRATALACRATPASASSPRSSRRGDREGPRPGRRPVAVHDDGRARSDRRHAPQTVNGLKFTVTQDMQWVEPGSTTSAVRQRRCRQQLDPPGVRVGDLAGHGRDRSRCGRSPTLSPPVGAYSAATGSIGGQGARRRPACPSPNINVQITGPTTADADRPPPKAARSSRYLPPGAYTVTVIAGTGVGDQELLDPEPDRLGDRRPDRVAARSTTTPRRRSRHRLVGARPRRPATGHPDRRREHRPAAVRASTRTRPAPTSLDAAVPVPERLHGVRRQLHRQQPARQGHEPATASTTTPAPTTVTVTPGGIDDRATVPLYTSRSRS